MKVDKAVMRKVTAIVLIAGLALLAVIGAAADDGPQKGFVLFGLSRLYDGTEQISGGVGELLAGNEQLVEGLDTLGGALDEDIAGSLETMKGGVDEQILPGLGDIIAGISGKVVPGLGDMKTAIDGKMVPGLGEMQGAIHFQIAPGLESACDGIEGRMSPGLDRMAGAIESQMIPGLGDIHGGLKEQISPGLGEILAGISGEMIPGLTQIRYGLSMAAHPDFDRQDTDTYGVSEALGAALFGITMTEDPYGSSGLEEGLTKIKGGAEALSAGLDSAIFTIGRPRPARMRPGLTPGIRLLPQFKMISLLPFRLHKRCLTARQKLQSSAGLRRQRANWMLSGAGRPVGCSMPKGLSITMVV